MRTVYKNPSKGQFEWQMVETLQTEIKDFPRGEIEKRDPPDFIVRTPEKTFGIEVTTAMNPNHAGAMPLAAIRTAQHKCLKLAKEMLRSKRVDPLEVKVKFRDDYAPIDIQEAARELCDFVLKKVGSTDDVKKGFYRGSKLKHIRQIWINLGTTSGKRWLKDHRVGWSHGNLVNTNPHDIIQKAIDPKNVKISSYQSQCDECWLIIGVNELTAPEAITVEYNDDSTYSSDFARTYFVRAVEGRVWRLNTVPLDTSSL